MIKNGHLWLEATDGLPSKLHLVRVSLEPQFSRYQLRMILHLYHGKTRKKKFRACECEVAGVTESLGIKRYKYRLIFIQDHSVVLQDVTKGMKGYTKRGNCFVWNIS